MFTYTIHVFLVLDLVLVGLILVLVGLVLRFKVVVKVWLSFKVKFKSEIFELRVAGIF